MLTWIAQNTVAALGIALLAVCASLLFKRRPAATHVLWLCVLVALVAPPLPRHRALDGRQHAQRFASDAVDAFAGLGRTTAALIEGVDQPDPEGQPSPQPAGKGEVGVDRPSRSAIPSMEERSRSHTPSYKSEPEEKHAAEESVPSWANETVRAEGAPAVAVALPPLPPDRPSLASRIPGVLISLWLIGAGVCAARQASLLFGVRRLLAGARPPSPTLARDVLFQADALGVPAPRIRVSNEITSPFIWGSLRPVLVWPEGERLDAPGSRAVLAHELAHLARRDHWVAWFELFVMCALWWHPLAHIARARLRQDAERACDAWVIWAYPSHRRDYADALVDALERLALRPAPAPALGAVDAERRTLTRRLMMIMNDNVARRGSRILALGAIALTAALTPTWAAGPRPATYETVSGDINEDLRPLLEAERLDWEAGILARGDDPAPVIERLAKLTKLRPDDGSAWEDYAMALYDAERWGEAAKAFARQAELDPSDADAFYNVACCRALDGDPKAALASLRDALEHGYSDGGHPHQDSDLESLWDDERFSDLVHRIGDLEETLAAAEEAMSEERWEDGRQAFANAVTIAPADASAHHLHAFCSLRAGDTRAAREGWERAKELGFKKGICVYNLACVAAMEGRTEDGLALLEKSLAAGFDDYELLAEDPDLETLHGESRFREIVASAKRPAQLKKEMEVAMDNDEWDTLAETARAYHDAAADEWGRAWALDQFGIASFRQGNFEKAEQAFTKAAATGYDLGDSLYNIACCRAQSGDSEGALEYLEAAIEAGFDHADHMREDKDLAPIHGHPGFEKVAGQAADRGVLEGFAVINWDHLRDRSRRQIENDPRDGAAHLQLGWALLRTGHAGDAVAVFERQAQLGHLTPIAVYNVACAHAIQGHEDLALAALESAIDHGFDQFDFIAEDPDLTNLRGNQRFQAILAEHAHDDVEDDTDHDDKHDKSDKNDKSDDDR